LKAFFSKLDIAAMTIHQANAGSEDVKTPIVSGDRLAISSLVGAMHITI
jgi:hypothetical protein